MTITSAERHVSPDGSVHEISEWQPMDAAVGPLVAWAGPSGEIEFRDSEWRMHRYSHLSIDLNPEGSS